MSVTVYVWAHDRGKCWGHSSLAVDDDCYVSWWLDSDMSKRSYLVNRNKSPKNAKFLRKLLGTDNIYKTAHVSATSYHDDVSQEGKDADVTVTIADNVLDEEKIRIWWKAYNYSKASYHSVKKNCSTTVIRALRAGGSDKLVPLGLRDTFGLSKYTGWEPTDIVNYLRKMAKKVNRGKGGEKIAFKETPKAEKVEELSNDGVTPWCTEHDFPLYTCPNC